MWEANCLSSSMGVPTFFSSCDERSSECADLLSTRRAARRCHALDFNPKNCERPSLHFIQTRPMMHATQ